MVAEIASRSLPTTGLIPTSNRKPRGFRQDGPTTIATRTYTDAISWADGSMLIIWHSTSANARVLQADSSNLQTTGNGGTECINYCSSKGYSIAGTGNGYECCKSLPHQLCHVLPVPCETKYELKIGCDNAIQGGNTVDQTPNGCVQPCAGTGPTGVTNEGCGNNAHNAVFRKQVRPIFYCVCVLCLCLYISYIDIVEEVKSKILYLRCASCFAV